MMEIHLSQTSNFQDYKVLINNLIIPSLISSFDFKEMLKMTSSSRKIETFWKFSFWPGLANFSSIFKNSVAKQNWKTYWIRICINQSAAIKIRAVIVDRNHSRLKLNTL